MRLLCMLFLGACCAGAWGQEPEIPPTEAPPPAERITPREIEDLRRQVEAAADLNDDPRQQALASLQSASDALRGISDLQAAQQRYIAQLDQIEETRADFEQKIAELQRRTPQRPAADASLPDLEQALARRERELAEAQAELDQLQNRIDGRGDRQRHLRERLTLNPRELEELRQQLERIAASPDPPLVREARRLYLLAERRRLEVEPGAIQSELDLIAAQEAVNLLAMERQLRADRVGRLRDEVSRWSQEVTQRRRTDAESRAATARSLAAQADVAEVKQIHLENAEIVEQELAVRFRKLQVEGEIRPTEAQRQQLDEEFLRVQQREGRIGTSPAFGIRLRQLRQVLPAPGDLRREIRRRVPEYEKANLERSEWHDRRTELDRIEQQIDRIVSGILATERQEDADVAELQERVRRVQADVRAALEQQRKHLDHILRAYDEWIRALEDLELEQNTLATLSGTFRRYIEQRVLWIPSHSPLTAPALVDDRESLLRLVSPSAWGEVVSVLLADMRQASWLYVLAALAWGILLSTRGIQKRTLRTYGQKATSRLNTSLVPTQNAWALTGVKSLVYPFPVLFLGWRLVPASQQHVHVLGESVLVVGLGMFVLELVRNVSRPYGLGVSHFGWPKRVNELISRQVGSFVVLAAPLSLVAAVLRSRRVEGGDDALERLIAIAVSLLLAFALHRLTSRRTGIVQEWTQAHPEGWIDRLSELWHILATLIPTILAVLTVIGYVYAAERLSVRLVQSLLVVYVAVFLRAFLFRWLTLRQRRLAIERAREIRAAMAQMKTEGDGPTAVQEVQEAHSNLEEVSTAAKRLLNTTIVVGSLVGLWLIWVDVFPALHYFDTWTLPGTDVSLEEAVRAILVIILTTTAARNIPGLLEMMLLDRLPLDRSVRYAVGALTRYVIVILGLLAIGDVLGIGWTQIQWLAAALTFGLGFGLQEIFANFVSGVIILFEQPARVGDIVTIDGVTGSVTRIRIRSTTIMDWDRKEYIVPNKEFITGRLLNWTLTDTTNRITVKVGVSYSSDPEQVQEILVNVARTQEHVLEEPEPRIFFDGFGESSLNFTVFVFLSSMEYRLVTIHGLHSRIHKAFGEAKIEIPFPQRDLHVRSAVPIPHLVKDAAPQASETPGEN